MNANTKQHVTAFALTCPLLLNAEEQHNPYLFIKDFFEFASIEEHKKEVSAWYRSAVSMGVCYENANNVIFLHSQLIQLLQAGYLIATNKTSPNHTNTSLEYLRERLTIETITHIRYGLGEWLFSALNKENDLSNAEHEHSFTLYELLVSLIEASHQIMIDDMKLNGVEI